ncbi:hypothetical protein BC629DRAFT_1598062 [Irpex lacteus]|nr:hypothetical protein BC629DRAFT_1598062 [Irpex lacteus]
MPPLPRSPSLGSDDDNSDVEAEISALIRNAVSTIDGTDLLPQALGDIPEEVESDAGTPYTSDDLQSVHTDSSGPEADYSILAAATTVATALRQHIAEGSSAPLPPTLRHVGDYVGICQALQDAATNQCPPPPPSSVIPIRPIPAMSSRYNPDTDIGAYPCPGLSEIAEGLITPCHSCNVSRAPTPLPTNPPSSAFNDGEDETLESNMRWVVLAGLKPAIYFSAEDADNAAGPSGFRCIIPHDSTKEASLCWMNARRKGQIITLAQ